MGHWLKGLTVNGRLIVLGTGFHCICCGTFLGCGCVSLPDDWEPPVCLEIDWPFTKDNCPLCNESEYEEIHKLITPEIISRQPLRIIRKGLELRKKLKQ